MFGLWVQRFGIDGVTSGGGNHTTQCETWDGSQSIPPAESWRHADARGRGRDGCCSNTSDYSEERHGTLRRCVGCGWLGVFVCVCVCCASHARTDQALDPMKVTIGFEDPRGRRQTLGSRKPRPCVRIGSDRIKLPPTLACSLERSVPGYLPTKMPGSRTDRD